MPIENRDDAWQIDAAHQNGFFDGWPNPPSPKTHLALLQNSDCVVIAFDLDRDVVAGYVTAVTDHVLCACIPLLEVLPAYRRQGIGPNLFHRVLTLLDGFYMVDLQCDEHMQTFYENRGMHKSRGMMLRRYEYQSGHPSHGQSGPVTPTKNFTAPNPFPDPSTTANPPVT